MPYYDEDIREMLDRVERDVAESKRLVEDRMIQERKSFGLYGVGWVWTDANGHRLKASEAMSEPSFDRLPKYQQEHIRKLAKSEE